MLCPNGHPSPDENNFCGICGAPLPLTGGVTLKDLLDAGLLKAGNELTIGLHGKDVTATLLSNGKIMYQHQIYEGPLACVTVIRGHPCDGWSCWRAKDHTTGRSFPIGHYRGALLEQRGAPHHH